MYWNIRVIDENDIGHTQILDLLDSELILKCISLLYAQLEVTREIVNLKIISETDEDDYDEDNKDCAEMIAVTVEAYAMVEAEDYLEESDSEEPNLVLAKIAFVTADRITVNSMDRDRRLRELLKKKELLPPDIVDLAIKEGYDLENIAIVAIEEIT
jgi:hypothetical protein